MNIKEVLHNSEEYLATVALRERILRTPLGLSFSSDELAQESNQIHLAAFDRQKLIGCLVLIPGDGRTIKMRQLAVEPDSQGTGIGTSLVRFAEEFSRHKGFSEMSMHARESARSFYEKLGYTCVSETFIEVTIPHVKMLKKIDTE